MATLTAPTLQQLLSEVRILLNQMDEKNSFWKDAELTNYLNEAVRQYFVECVVANEGYFTTQTSLAIVANQETVTLPTDCFEVRAVYKAVANGYVLLPYNNDLTSGYFSTGNATGDGYTPSYHFRGNSLVLRPTPNDSNATGILLTYLQFPDQMVWGGDSMTSNVSPVFKQLIITYAVYKAKWRESLVSGVNTYALAEAHLGRIYKTFVDAIARRSKAPTHTVAFDPEN